MKVFQEKPQVQQYATAAEFVKEFSIGKGDFILASKSIYEGYFAGLCEGAEVRFKTDYGKSEPTDVMLNALLEDFRKLDCNRIIAIGGGAVIDMAKILVLDTDACAADIYQRKTELIRKRELIAVPTTCGAGSEVSNVSIVELTELGTKLGLADDKIYADYAVLIPELLEKLPYHFFATSAIDAFIHAIESYVSPKANRYTRMFSKEAMAMILGGFKKVIEGGEEVRKSLLGDFLVASNLAGIAFGNAGTGAVHAMSYPLSGTYHVAHGEANYQFLVAVFQKYTELKPDGGLVELNEFLADVLGCEVGVVYDELANVLGKIITKKPLREYGMKPEEARVFAESCDAGQQRLLNQSYVKFDVEIMEEIYRSLY
ncbi:MAG: 4-hydroxybutyrate dehydrogenase [Tyzzerella sp.]|nr:4-hydroxybutyrate dehydrogenase [Tyzzerella sp.]